MILQAMATGVRLTFDFIIMAAIVLAPITIYLGPKVYEFF